MRNGFQWRRSSLLSGFLLVLLSVGSVNSFGRPRHDPIKRPAAATSGRKNVRESDVVGPRSGRSGVRTSLHHDEEEEDGGVGRKTHRESFFRSSKTNSNGNAAKPPRKIEPEKTEPGTKDATDLEVTTRSSDSQFHATRTENGGSGAILTRHNHAASSNAIVSVEPKKDRTAGLGRTSSAGGTSSGNPGPTSSNTKGERRGRPGQSRAFGHGSNNQRNIHLGNRDNDDNRKTRRGLKARGGVGSLQVKPNAVKAGKRAVGSGSPIDCLERAGKKCKRGGGEQRAGEVRGPTLTQEGGEEKLVEPDFSLAEEDADEVRQELSSSTIAWIHNVGGTVDDASKRFYGSSSSTKTESTASGTTDQSAGLVEVDATGEEVDENEIAEDRKGKDVTVEVSEFTPRAIPNRYGGVHNQHSTYIGQNTQQGQIQQTGNQGQQLPYVNPNSQGQQGGNQNQDFTSFQSGNQMQNYAYPLPSNPNEQNQNQQQASTQSQTVQSATGGQGGQGGQAAGDQPAWVAGYYQQKGSIYSDHPAEESTAQEQPQNVGASGGASGSGTQLQSVSSVTAAVQSTNSQQPEATETETSAAEDTGSGFDPDGPPGDSSANAYEFYKEWFQDIDEMDTGGDGGEGDGSDVGFYAEDDGTNQDAFFDEDDEVDENVEGGDGTESDFSSFFDDEEDEDYDEDGDGMGGGQGDIDPTASVVPGPYLSFFGSSTLAPIVFPSENGTIEAAGATQVTGDLSGNNPTLVPAGIDQTNGSAQPPSTITGTETTLLEQDSTSTLQTEDEGGTTFFYETVAASPVYVETTGLSDLHAHKEEVFQSLEPLLSRHLESLFGENFIESYQMTITYVRSEDSVHQLRRGSDAKTFVTQLVVFVVFHLRTLSEDDISIFTETVASEAVEQFFDESNPELKSFLRILNAKGLNVREIHAQGQPHPPRNHAMEHGISHITPSNTTAPPEPEALEEEADEGVWSFFTNLFESVGPRVAIIAAAASGLFVVVAVAAAVCYNKSRRRRLAGRGRYILDSASDVASEYGSRAQHSIQSMKSRIQHTGSRASGYLSFGTKSSSGSSVMSDASSKLSYIQPAAIQRRKNRVISVPQEDDTPLQGRQDDDFGMEGNKPESVYDIDIDDEDDFRGVRHQAKHKKREIDIAQDEDEDVDEESDSSDSSDDDTISRQSKLSLDRISIARSSKKIAEPVRKLRPVQERRVEPPRKLKVTQKNRVEPARRKQKVVDKKRYMPAETFEDDHDDDEYDAADLHDDEFGAEQGSVHILKSVSRASSHSESSRGDPDSFVNSVPVYDVESIAQSSMTSASKSIYRRDADDYLMTQKSFVPLSPLSSLLAEAMGESPKSLTHTASRPRSPPRARRRGMDPPPSHSYTTDNYHYGYRITPPSSMHDIMPDEYINKKRWQDDEEDTTVNLPDHVSSGATQYSMSTRHSNTESSYMSGMTTERQLVVYEGEEQGKNEHYRY
ncbi:expressed unknown protein [Seminavis robusta]|uniref:Uncharacterized protein n=1 Tax=Seminavis robusta TaxID=568900 RepID=A0A9N8HJC1_9STRA|nr:expressed unknown protein [Seminavis robusta]|eukprot:Sro651_g181610.1 n/a (1465) ;mRNA; r:42174-46783